MFDGVTRTDEQHIMQKTTAKKRYPVLEKLLEFDLDLTNLSDSSLSSLAAERRFNWLGLLIEVVDIVSTSSKMFLPLLLGRIPRDSSRGLDSFRSSSKPSEKSLLLIFFKRFF